MQRRERGPLLPVRNRGFREARGSHIQRSRKEERGPYGRQYVGIDLHRRRSVVVHKSADGEVLGTAHIENAPMALVAQPAKAAPKPTMVLEVTSDYYWAADVVADCGAELHPVP